MGVGPPRRTRVDGGPPAPCRLDAIVASVVERGTREEAARVAGAAVPSAAGDDTTAALLAMADTTNHPLGLVAALAPHDTAEDRALLVAAAREGSDAGRSAALRALGLQNDDIVIELAPPLLGTDTPLPLRIAARQAIRKLTSYRPACLGPRRGQGPGGPMGGRHGPV